MTATFSEAMQAGTINATLHAEEVRHLHELHDGGELRLGYEDGHA